MDPTADDLQARLRRNPDDLDALNALRAHYRQEGDYEGLAKLLEGWAARCRDRQAAAEGLREAADVVTSLLSDDDRAVALLTRALERDPRNTQAAEMIERLLVDADNHQRLVEVLERRATALGAAKADPSVTGALHHRLGELWEKELGRVDRAVFHYRKAFELDPSLLEAIYAARQIYLQAGNLKAAASLYDLEANAENDVPRKVALLRELAHLRSEELGDLEGAVVALKRAMQATPDDLAVKHELAAALVNRAGHMGDEGAAQEDLRRSADLFFELAGAVPEHAIAYCEATLDARPGHEDAMGLLEQLAEQQGRQDVLPPRWVAFLQAAPESPNADARRERLGHAYVAAGQGEDAIACFEPLMERGNAAVAERLVELYREVGRDQDVPAALTVVVDQLPEERRVPRLHELVKVLVAQGRHDEAVVRAREILQLDPTDEDALRLVDDHYRARGDFEPLRQLLLSTVQSPSLSRETRKERMLEVARISEEELDDRHGALDAWREVVQLDRTDRDAQAARLRLLEEAERWDDVAWALDSWLEVETDPDTRADLLHKLASTQRSRRGDSYSAIEALRSLRELRPEDDWARNSLCELLLEVDRALDAIPVLRECVEQAPDGAEQGRLLRTLAKVLEERAGDEEGASEAWSRLLDLQPDDAEALDRLEAIDVRNQRYDRLLSTLGHRVDVVAPEERPALLERMARLADERLGDLDRAAEHYFQALEIAPEDDARAEALAEVLERASRWNDLVDLLRTRADRSEETGARAAFHRRIARTLASKVGDDDRAAESWREVLQAGEDEEALRALRAHADRKGDTEALVEWISRLAAIVADPGEKRSLMMEQAELLADVLSRPEEAAEVLRRVVTEVAPNDVPALIRLAEVCDAVGDDEGLADALERHLRSAESPEERLPLASRLAQLYDEQLGDRGRAIEAFGAWAGANPDDDVPRRRLAELLEEEERWEPLVAVLDELAGLEPEDDLVGELKRKAANLSAHQLGDLDGAWNRLAPLVEAGDALAEDSLGELSLATGRAEALADLYVRMAKAAEAEAAEQRRRWMDAAKIYEAHVEDPQRALEAMLRAFATDLHDEQMLGEVDRLAVAAGAFLRLAQVYETLVRKHEAPEDKQRLLLRHADLLEEHAGDPSAALDRVLRAAALDPMDDDVARRAESLARGVERLEELLVLYDRRRAQAPDPTGALEALLRAVRLAEADLGDRERAEQYLLQAVQTAMEDLTLLDFLENEVRELDEAGPGDALRRQLVTVYRNVADSRGEPAAPLLERGARLLADELEDEEAAYRLLRNATELAPGSDALLDAFEDLARSRERLQELDRHLAKLVDEAIDSRTAAHLLRRRGHLLEELGRHGDAAEVYRRLLPLVPDDQDVSERLRHCLRQAKDFQDLLLVLDRELARTREPQARTELLKEVARTWENDLRNRWEALDAWKKVRSTDPGDAEAEEAIERLGQRRRLADDESLFAEESEPEEPPAGAEEGEGAAEAETGDGDEDEDTTGAEDQGKAGDEDEAETGDEDEEETGDGDEERAKAGDEDEAETGDGDEDGDEERAKAGDEDEAETGDGDEERAKAGDEDEAETGDEDEDGADEELPEEADGEEANAEAASAAEPAEPADAKELTSEETMVIDDIEELDLLEESEEPPKPSVPPPPPGDPDRE